MGLPWHVHTRRWSGKTYIVAGMRWLVTYHYNLHVSVIFPSYIIALCSPIQTLQTTVSSRIDVACHVTLACNYTGCMEWRVWRGCVSLDKRSLNIISPEGYHYKANRVADNTSLCIHWLWVFSLSINDKSKRPHPSSAWPQNNSVADNTWPLINASVPSVC